MACNPDTLKHVPLFALLDDDEAAVLAGQVEEKKFAPRQRIFKMGDPSGPAYVVVSGRVRLTTVDADNQEVVMDEPTHGEFFGFASMLEQTQHQTSAMAIDEVECLEVTREDISVLLQRKPLAGMDMLTVLGRQFHAAQQLVRKRSARSVDEIFEKRSTFGERIADSVAQFGGSWTFIIVFGAVLAAYTMINVHLGQKAWDPYPFILLNLFLSMLAAVQAPVIMMSQNRQSDSDRAQAKNDYEVNVRTELEIMQVHRKIDTLRETELVELTELVKRQDAALQEINQRLIIGGS